MILIKKIWGDKFIPTQLIILLVNYIRCAASGNLSNSHLHVHLLLTFVVATQYVLEFFILIHVIGLIICIPLTNRPSPILRFQAGSAITMECICVHKYILYRLYILQVHITSTLGMRCPSINRWRVMNVRGALRWPRWRVRRPRWLCVNSTRYTYWTL